MVDEELLLRETMARLLSREGNHWMGSGKSKLSVTLAHYLDNRPDKEQAGLIGEAPIDTNLTAPDL